MKKILLVILILVLVVVLGFALTVTFFGKKILEDKLGKSLKMPVELESVSFSLPLSVKVSGLKLGDLFSAEKISFFPNLLGVFAGRILLSGVRIDKAELSLVKAEDGSLNLPKFAQSTGQESRRGPGVLITGLSITDSKFIFLNKKVSLEGHKIILDNLNLKLAKNMLPPTSKRISFKASTALKGGAGNAIGTLMADGWVDFGPKDMDATLEVKDLEAAYFQPYYGDFLSHRKIVSATLNLTSLLKAKNNDLEVSSNLKISRIIYASEEAGDQEVLPQLNLTRDALDLFSDRNGNLNLDFEFRTQLDHPRLKGDELKRAIMDAALRNLASQPPEDLIQKAQDIYDKFKDFGKQMKDIFKNKE